MYGIGPEKDSRWWDGVWSPQKQSKTYKNHVVTDQKAYISGTTSIPSLPSLILTRSWWYLEQGLRDPCLSRQIRAFKRVIIVNIVGKQHRKLMGQSADLTNYKWPSLAYRCTYYYPMILYDILWYHMILQSIHASYISPTWVRRLQPGAMATGMVDRMVGCHLPAAEAERKCGWDALGIGNQDSLEWDSKKLIMSLKMV